MNQDHPKTPWERTRILLVWIGLPLVLGMLISLAIPRPLVGTIRLDTTIDSYSAPYLIAQIDYARQHPEIRAVVLLVDSPGGTVADTEAVYQELLALRKLKPVVVSIGSMAASGAFYLSVGTDYIFANPTSEVGNVGVIGYLPDNPEIYESIISTGPYKLWGEPRDAFQREMEMVKQGFYQAVSYGRGDRLKVGPEILLTGRIWLGSEAYRLGLIDALGSQTDALEKAAQLTHVAHYQVADLAFLSEAFSSAAYPFNGLASQINGAPTEPGIYLLYLPPSMEER